MGIWKVEKLLERIRATLRRVQIIYRIRIIEEVKDERKDKKIYC